MPKRNTHGVRHERRLRTDKSGAVGARSAYAKKVRSGRQTYGPGCCAHRIRLPYYHEG